MYSTRAVIPNEIKNPDRMSGFFITKTFWIIRTINSEKAYVRKEPETTPH